jgi:ABC-type glycerol-3-phosphate transport system substrate-binding protein
MELMRMKDPWEVAADIYQDKEISSLGLCKFVPPPEFKTWEDLKQFSDWLKKAPDVTEKIYHVQQETYLPIGLLVVRYVKDGEPQSLLHWFNARGGYFKGTGGKAAPKIPDMELACSAVSCV